MGRDKEEEDRRGQVRLGAGKDFPQLRVSLDKGSHH